MDLCRRGDQRKNRRLEEEEAWSGSEMVFKAYGHHLTMVSSLKYLCRVIPYSDDDWTEVVTNILNEWKTWARIFQVLGWEGMDTNTSGIFYKVVIQEVLLLGLETWLMTPLIGRTLGVFHHEAS